MGNEWTPADRRKLTIGYEDATINFTCPCGNDVFLSGDEGPVRCDCGRAWRYVTQLQIANAEEDRSCM